MNFKFLVSGEMEAYSEKELKVNLAGFLVDLGCRYFVIKADEIKSK